jgi:iron(III) transport system ATP-binding protein
VVLAGRADGPVHLAVRPEQLQIRGGERSANAEVVDREFRGHDVLYRLRHEGGRMLLVQLPSLELFEVGAQVYVSPAPKVVAPLVD